MRHWWCSDGCAKALLEAFDPALHPVHGVSELGQLPEEGTSKVPLVQPDVALEPELAVAELVDGVAVLSEETRLMVED